MLLRQAQLSLGLLYSKFSPNYKAPSPVVHIEDGATVAFKTRKAGETVTSARGEFQEDAQRRLNEIEAMLNVFRSRLYVAQQSNRAGGKRKLLQLRGQKLIVENRLSELKAASDSGWWKLRDRFEGAAGSLEQKTAAALKGLR